MDKYSTRKILSQGQLRQYYPYFLRHYISVAQYSWPIGYLPGILCERDILVLLAYKNEKKNYLTKYEGIINRALIIASADTGTDMEKTKDVPFQKDFDVDTNLLWDTMHNVFGGTTVWVNVKPFASIKNRRYALFILNKLLLGLQYINNVATRLDTNKKYIIL